MQETWDAGLIPGLGRSPGEGNGNPLQYSCLANPMNREAWWAIVHGVAKCWIWLKWFRIHVPPVYGFPFGSTCKESACNAGRFGFDPWISNIPWRSERLPNSVFSPGEFHGQLMALQGVRHDRVTFTICTMQRTSIHSSSGTLSIRSNPMNLFVTSTV